MSVWSEIEIFVKRTAADIKAVVNRLVFLERLARHMALDVNTEYSQKDENTNRYTKITYKRLDGTVARSESYEIDPDLPAEVPPVRNLKVVTVFAKNGITILEEAHYRVTYDDDDFIVSEIKLSE